MAANRRIIIAMSMLLVAIFASVSVTFAWFSSGTLASAIFSLTTRSNKDHLYIQVGETELAKERSDDFSQSIVQLRDLTYAESESGKWGLYREDGQAAQGADYIHHTYTFYTDNPLKTVYLLRSESDVRSDYMVRQFIGADKDYWLKEGKNNENIAKFYGTTDISKTNDFTNTVVWRRGEAGETAYYFNSRNGAYATSAANAARIMFFEGTHSVIPAEGPSSMIWEPNAGEGYDAAGEDGNYKYEQVSSYYRNANRLGGNDAVGREAPGNTVSYSAINGDVQLFAASAWQRVDAAAADYHTEAPYKFSVTLALWLEGRDADCFNVIIKDVINVDFSFELV